FQAEDGIRDRTVTGVQTCALPIFSEFRQHSSWPRISIFHRRFRTQLFAHPILHSFRPLHYAVLASNLVLTSTVSCRQENDPQERSEERRVGKECRYRWSR